MDPLGGSGGRGSETAKKFNVALTRGKALNVVVGNPLILEQDRHWRRLIEFTAERRSYRGCRCAWRGAVSEMIDDLGAGAASSACTRVGVSVARERSCL